MKKHKVDEIKSEIYTKIIDILDEKDVTNEEFLVILSKLNEQISNDLTYFLSKSLPR